MAWTESRIAPEEERGIDVRNEADKNNQVLIR